MPQTAVNQPGCTEINSKLQFKKWIHKLIGTCDHQANNQPNDRSGNHLNVFELAKSFPAKLLTATLTIIFDEKDQATLG